MLRLVTTQLRRKTNFAGNLTCKGRELYLTSNCKQSRMAGRAIGATVRTVARKKPIIPTRAPLTLTPSAVTKVKELMVQQPDMVGLKIGVKTRGCNGLTYTLDYCKEKGKFDEVVEQGGVKVVIDSKAQLTLLGTEMDYVENKLSAEFVFNNPNIKGTCGCGESFNV